MPLTNSTCQPLHRQSTPRGRAERLPGWILTAAAIGCVLLGTACRSVRTQSSINPESPVVTPFRSAVVVVVDERGEVRKVCESRLVRLLQARTVQTAASYTNFGVADLKLSREEILQKLRAWNAEAVLLVRVADRESFNNPTSWSGELAGPGLTWFDVDQFRAAFYGSGSDIRTAFTLESRLYRLDRGALVWTALTGFTAGETADRLELITKVLGKIVDQLAKDQLIP